MNHLIVRTLIASALTTLSFACDTGESDDSADSVSDSSTAPTDGSADADEADSTAEPDAPDALGPYVVGHGASIVVDSARGDRELPIDLWYPVDSLDAEGAQTTAYTLAEIATLESEVSFEDVPVASDRAHPLLVFSHGYQSVNLQSIGLMEALASHGFIVVSPEHTGNSQFSAGDEFDVAAANRVPDISVIIDTMLERADDPDDLLYERIDIAAIGVVGHSFGGMTSFGVAAGWAGADPDPRVAAIAPVSGVIDGDLQEADRDTPNAGFSQTQLESITIPALLLGGTEDTNVPIENNAIAFSQMTNAAVVYKVDVIGANHTHFANVCTFGDLLIELGVGPETWGAIGAGGLTEPYEATCTEDAFPIDEAIRLQNLYVVAFFRLHLSGEAAYEQYLTAEYADTEPAINFSRRPDPEE